MDKQLGYFDLQVMYDSRQSFYGKAKVVQDSRGTHLYSYDTLCASILDGKAEVYNVQSQTTLRHVKEFLLQHNFKADSKKQIIEDYFVEMY